MKTEEIKLVIEICTRVGGFLLTEFPDVKEELLLTAATLLLSKMIKLAELPNEAKHKIVDQIQEEIHCYIDAVE